jgi:hypothetical protein
MMMFQALRSLIPSEDLLYAIIVVWVDMSDPSAPFWKHRKTRPRKKCPNKLIMALDLRLSIRIWGIRHLTKLHGGKHQGIKLIGLMHLDSRHLSISGLSSDLFQPIRVAPQRPNLSSLEGLRRWKRNNSTVSHLSGCRAWWSVWISKWSPASNLPQEGRLGSRRRTTVTPWGGMDAPSKRRCTCLGSGS